MEVRTFQIHQIYSVSIMNKDFSYLASELILVRKTDNNDLMKIIDEVNSEEKNKAQSYDWAFILFLYKEIYIKYLLWCGF